MKPRVFAVTFAIRGVRLVTAGEGLHRVERFRSSPDGNTLRLVQRYEDAAVFDGVAARYMAWTRRPGECVYPYDCDPAYGE